MPRKDTINRATPEARAKSPIVKPRKGSYASEGERATGEVGLLQGCRGGRKAGGFFLASSHFFYSPRAQPGNVGMKHHLTLARRAREVMALSHPSSSNLWSFRRQTARRMLEGPLVRTSDGSIQNLEVHAHLGVMLRFVG